MLDVAELSGYIAGMTEKQDGMSADGVEAVGREAPVGGEAVSVEPVGAATGGVEAVGAGEAGSVEAGGEVGEEVRELTSDAMPLPQVLEAILFSTDVPLSAGKLAEIVGLDSTKPVKLTIEQLNKGYEQREAAYRVEERAGGYQLLTLPQYAQYIERLVKKKDEGRLTPASLETLAIVAYKQPMTRAGIEAIRGVACGRFCGR